MQDKVLNLTPATPPAGGPGDPFNDLGLTKLDIANQVADLQVRVRALEP